MTTKNTKAPLAIAIAPAVAIIERPINAIAADLVLDDKGNVNFAAGKPVSAYELGMYAAENMNNAESATLRAANALILARNLPDVDLASGKKMAAFDIAKAVLEDKAKTKSAYYNALGMVTAVDVWNANSGQIGHVTPFVLKEAMGTLNREKLIDPKTLKIKSTATAPAPVKKLVAAMRDKKNPIAVNAIRPFIQAAQPPKATKAPKATEKPYEWTVDALVRQLTTLLGAWDKTVEKSSVEAVRKGTQGEFEKLAKLAGFTFAGGFTLAPVKSEAKAPEVKAPAPVVKK